MKSGANLVVRLKPNREKPVRQGHPWIFSGAIEHIPPAAADGDIVDVAAADGRWLARGYDCSGSVSFALHGAGLLDGPLVSGDFARWGAAGPGSWVTIYANGGHVFMIVAGLRFDTSGQRESGSRWQAAPRRVRGFKVRHPVGL